MHGKRFWRLWILPGSPGLHGRGMLLPDNRLATTQPMRSRAWFDYINEFLDQDAIRPLIQE